VTITNDHLLLERPHRLGGVQRIYRFKSGYGLSVVNAPMLHSYPFSWEIAVLKDVKEDGRFSDICYDTPLTDDVEVFPNDAEANAFIERAALEIGGAL
jgi:hypothetical protein